MGVVDLDNQESTGISQLYFQTSETHLQWRASESDSWTNGILLSELGGSSGNTWDLTLTQATSGFDLNGKNVKITVSSGTAIALDTILSYTNMTNLSESRIEVLNSTGGALEVNTTQKNTFDGSFKNILNTQYVRFLATKNGAGVVEISYAGRPI